MTSLERVARLLRTVADRIDRAHAPRNSGLTLRFQDHVGAVVEWHGDGCSLWYLGDEDYARAHTAGPKRGGMVPR